MTRRYVAVLAVGDPAERPDAPLAAAMLEDVVDMVEAMQQVQGALLATAAGAERARAAAWPDMPVVVLTDAAGPPPGIATALDALADLGADEGAVVCADAPDLPPLLLGKLFSALTSAEAAVCPAEGGGLVALAARLPVSPWLRASAPALDDLAGDVRVSDDPLARLRAAAPLRGLHVGPGWHRVRSAADVDRLDPGLEGWEATRALLAEISRRES